MSIPYPYRWIAPAVVFLWNAEALACPLCHTGTGKEARAGIFGGGDFLFNLFVVAAPFPIMALLVAWIYFGPPRFLLRRRETSLRTAQTDGKEEQFQERIQRFGDAS